VERRNRHRGLPESSRDHDLYATIATWSSGTSWEGKMWPSDVFAILLLIVLGLWERIEGGRERGDEG